MNLQKSTTNKVKITSIKNWKLLFKYLSYHKVSLIFQFLIAILTAGISIAIGVCLQYVIVEVGKDFARVCLIAGLMLGAYIIESILQYVQYKLTINMGEKISEKMRNDLFKKINQLSIKYYENNKAGDTMSRFTNDINNISLLISNNFADIIGVIIWCSGIVIALFLISSTLTLITLVLIIFVILALKICIQKSQPFFQKNQVCLAEITSFLEESISGQTVVDIYNQYENMFKRFEKINKEATLNTYKSQLYGAGSVPIVSFATSLIMIFVTVIGIVFINQKISFYGIPINLPSPNPALASLTSLTVFLLLARNFMSPFNQVASVMTMIMSANAGLLRIQPIFDEKSEFNDFEKLIVTISNSMVNNNIDLEKTFKNNETVLKPKIELKNLKFGYLEDKLVLKGLNFTINPGDFIGIVGPTGCGKTTLINLITKFYDVTEPDSDILIDSVSIKEIDKKSMRRNVSMVLQDTYLFNISVKENLKLANPDATDEEIIEAAKKANCHDLIMKLPDQYDTILENNADLFSKGEKQMLSIARAILSKSNILILDEATSSVDSKTEKEIQKSIEHLMKNKTSIMIAHRLSTVRNATKIIVMKEGQIVETGNHDELLELNGFYASLFYSQLGNIVD